MMRVVILADELEASDGVVCGRLRKPVVFWTKA